MGVFTYENDTTSTVPPAKLFKAVVHDADVIVPKIVDSIKTVEIVEGNGGPGTVKKITFVEGGQTLYVLHKIEAIDDAKFEYKGVETRGDRPETSETCKYDVSNGR
ncbi:hypothetical protein RYX36_027217 [Vicia faba]